MFTQLVSKARTAVFLAVALTVIFGARLTMGQRGVPASAGQPSAAPTAADLDALNGAIDIHVHLDPDSAGPNSRQAARGLDVIDMAKLAKARGMRGFVIKQHYDQSAQLAYLVRKEVPGIEAFGLVGSNFSMGGINVAAVQHLAEVKGGWGRMVMLPTWDSEENVRVREKQPRPFVAVSRNGELVPELKEVISVIAKTKTRESNGEMSIATGHIAAKEVLLVLQEGQRQGVKHMVVTHARHAPPDMTMAQMQEAVNLGAFIEFVADVINNDATAEKTLREYVQAIRQLGVEHVILSTDMGQEGRPLFPPDGLAAAAKAYRGQGFTARELAIMMKENPARLLGIPVSTSQSSSRP